MRSTPKSGIMTHAGSTQIPLAEEFCPAHGWKMAMISGSCVWSHRQAGYRLRCQDGLFESKTIKMVSEEGFELKIPGLKPWAKSSSRKVSLKIGAPLHKLSVFLPRIPSYAKASAGKPPSKLLHFFWPSFSDGFIKRLTNKPITE